MKNRFEDTQFIKKLKYLLYFSLGAFVIIGFFIDSHPHFNWEGLPAFFAIYGFVICSVLIFGARALGQFLLRKEDYYD